MSGLSNPSSVPALFFSPAHCPPLDSRASLAVAVLSGDNVAATSTLDEFARVAAAYFMHSPYYALQQQASSASSTRRSQSFLHVHVSVEKPCCSKPAEKKTGSGAPSSPWPVVHFTLLLGGGVGASGAGEDALVSQHDLLMEPVGDYYMSLRSGIIYPVPDLAESVCRILLDVSRVWTDRSRRKNLEDLTPRLQAADSSSMAHEVPPVVVRTRGGFVEAAMRQAHIVLRRSSF